MASKELDGLFTKAMTTRRAISPSVVVDNTPTDKDDPSVQVPKATAQKKSSQKKKPVPMKAEKNVPLQVMIPESVRHAAQTKAVENRMTMRALILDALKAYGLEVPQEQINDMRKS